jgi:hypothetical protein
MLEPLLDSSASGWIELRGVELSSLKFEQFITASWKREAVLLDRVSDTERIRRIDLDISNDPRLRPLQVR